MVLPNALDCITQPQNEQKRANLVFVHARGGREGEKLLGEDKQYPLQARMLI